MVRIIENIVIIVTGFVFLTLVGCMLLRIKGVKRNKPPSKMVQNNRLRFLADKLETTKTDDPQYLDMKQLYEDVKSGEKYITDEDMDKYKLRPKDYFPLPIP